MSQQPLFSQEELATQAQRNALPMLLETLGYLKKHEIAIADYARTLGFRFIGAWENMKGKSADTILKSMLWNILAYGAQLIRFSGDEQSAEATVDWPPQEALGESNLSVEDSHAFLTIYEPIASYLGMQYEYTSNDTQMTIKLSRS